MQVECWSNQQQEGFLFRKLAVGKISEAFEFATGVVPGHASPIIESLQRQVDVFVCLEFKHGEASLVSGCQHVYHRPIGCGKSRNLRIDATSIEALVEGAHIV